MSRCLELERRSVCNTPHLRHRVILMLVPSVKKSLQSGERKIPGEQWPAFVYEDYRYDSTNPWRGLFRSTLLVTVCSPFLKDTIRFT